MLEIDFNCVLIMKLYLQAHWAGAKRQHHLPKELVLRYIISSSSNQQQTANTMKQKTKRLKWHPTTCVLRQWGFSRWAEHLYFLLALDYRLYICTFYPPPHAKRRTVSGNPMATVQY